LVSLSIKHLENKEQSMTFNASPIVRTLADSIRLSLPPIALCFTDKVPSGIKNWTGQALASCRFWQEAATEVFATSPSDHDLCAIGTFTHNLETTEEHDTGGRDGLRVFADLSYVREQDIASIPVLEVRSTHVVYGPLATIPLTPDVVLLFVKADQMLLLSEAFQQVEGSLPQATGRPACTIVPQAINTGRAALSLGCGGSPSYVDVLTDEVAIWAIPGSKLDLYVESIATLSKANAILATFHQMARKDVEDGKNPTIKESSAAIARWK